VSTHAVLLFFQRMIRCEVPTFWAAANF
jgi:hypothetical protein